MIFGIGLCCIFSLGTPQLHSLRTIFIWFSIQPYVKFLRSFKSCKPLFKFIIVASDNYSDDN